MGCQIEVPASVMHHVVKVESSYNPYAIGVVGGHLVRQPKSLAEAVATAEMLESRGFNFSLGLAQVNRYNLKKYGLSNYSAAFKPCGNLLAGSQILRECHSRSGGNWGKAFSCYYSGNFTTGFRHGYVQKVQRSMLAQRGPETPSLALSVVDKRCAKQRQAAPSRATANAPSRAVAVDMSTRSVAPTRVSAVDASSLLERRMQLMQAPVANAPEVAAAAPAQEISISQPLQYGPAAPAVAVPTTQAPVPKPPPTRTKAEDAAFVF